MKFKIITLGCKVNTYESEYMREELLKSGFTLAEEEADIIIINTCSVTNTADSKSLKMVRRARRENPKAILVVCGCSVQNDILKYQDLDIQILIGNKGKSKIVQLLNNYLENQEDYTYVDLNRNQEFENMEVSRFTTHTRAFIKIQDGCNNFCSYCIIPYTRGSIRSKDFDLIMEEAKILVENGHQELVLTGIHTGSYESHGKHLSDLLEELAKIDSLARIRISSIEITELNDSFLEILRKESKIANHLHIPLQSGSDAILKRMNRKYDKEYFRKKIAQIREIRPDISITTDCIVGHPYETDKDFLEYLEFCKEIGFSKLHIFPFSKRTGTAASVMPQVDEKVKKERTKELLALSNVLEKKYMQQFLNQELEILTEEYYHDYVIGHTSNYLKVAILGDYMLNQRYLCRLETIENDYFIATVVACAEENRKETV